MTILFHTANECKTSLLAAATRETVPPPKKYLAQAGLSEGRTRSSKTNETAANRTAYASGCRSSSVASMPKVDSERG